MAKKNISTADLKKLFKEAHKLDPMKPMPKAVASRMDNLIDKLAAQEKASQSKSGNKKLSQMSDAEIKTNLKKLKAQQTAKNAKLAKNNAAVVSKIKTMRGGSMGRGGGAGGAFLENLK